MIDQELIDLWRKGFEVWYNLNYGFYAFYIKDAYAKYEHPEVELCWQSWLSSKLSQTVVELPKECPVTLENFEDGYEKCLEDIKESLTAAGIQFKVEE